VGYTVVIKDGLKDIALPSGALVQGGQTAILTDDQYLMLSSTASAALFFSVVHTGGGGGGAVSSVNTLTGDVVLTAALVGAYSSSQGSTLADRTSNVETVATGLNTLVTDAEVRVGGAETRLTALEHIRPITAFTRLKSEIVALPNTGGWAVVATSGAVPLSCQVTAAIGDRILADATFMRTGTGDYLDLAILTSAGAISEYAGSGTGTPLDEGSPAYYPSAGGFPGATGTTMFTVQSGQVNGSGKVEIALVYKGSGSGSESVYASATYPFFLMLTNIGPQPA
jgi:hypothetical protein